MFQFRFSLRYLFAAVGLIAIVCAIGPAVRTASTVNHLESLGAMVWLEDATGVTSSADVTAMDLIDKRVNSVFCGGLRPKDYQGVTKTTIGDAEFQSVCRLRSLQSIVLQSTNVTDGAMRQLRRVPQLTVLCLVTSQVGDPGLREIAQRTSLKELTLGNCRITDAGMVYLRELADLEYLNLSGNPITDASIPYLIALQKLTYLNVRRTLITPGGVEAIHAALPRCHVNHL